MAGHRVLVIEDSLTIRTLVHLALGKAGYVVDLAVTGGDGLAAAKKSPPDLVLLDYMLPDIKGTEVSAELARDPACARVPIIVMSGKNHEARGLFTTGNVVDFLGKPFSGPDLLARLQQVFDGRAAKPSAAPGGSAAARPSSAVSFARKEEAARLAYAHLKDRLALLPEWAEQRGPASPAPYFAKKLLTPDVVDALLDAFAPLVREAPAAGAAKKPGDLLLEGQLSLMPVHGLLKVLGAYGRTGQLTLEQGKRETLAYWRKGVVVLATTRDPVAYAENASFDLSNVPANQLEQACDEQRTTGKPLYVTLAEAGLLPASELPGLLYAQTKRVLLDATALGPGRFEWREQIESPLWVEAYGRPLSSAQLSLERLRGLPPAALDPALAAALVYERLDGFSRRIGQLELLAPERRVLACVDGRATVKAVIDKSGLPATEVHPILQRFAEIDLIRRKGGRGADANKSARAVMVLDPDEAGFVRPLTELLNGRADPLTVVPLTAGDWTQLIQRERPRLVVLNATYGGDQVDATARAVRATLEVSDTPLVAVLEAPVASRIHSLTASGFDAVFVKPVFYGDLDRFLVS
jgi:CheY-like chemotaxis protein